MLERRFSAAIENRIGKRNARRFFCRRHKEEALRGFLASGNCAEPADAFLTHLSPPTTLIRKSCERRTFSLVPRSFRPQASPRKKHKASRSRSRTKLRVGARESCQHRCRRSSARARLW